MWDFSEDITPMSPLLLEIILIAISFWAGIIVERRHRRPFGSACEKCERDYKEKR